MDYEVSGKLKDKSVVASQKGTTVSVESIFRNLPVRRKELEKNIKREYGKALALLHAYACISTGVKFSVSNQPAKGSKMVALSTKGNPTTKENITNVYGAKTTAALVALDLKLEMEPSVGLRSNATESPNAEDSSRAVRIKGHISRPVVGEGRQTPDRQMFFVNSRPCALPQVSKAFNEVYRNYNVTQSPFIFADLLMDTNAYDVNVSPDKREILLHDQTALLESLKTSLMELFDNHDQSVPKATVPSAKLPAFKPLTVTRPPPAAAQTTRPERQEVVLEDPRDLTPEVAATYSSTPGRPRNFIQDFAERKTEERTAPPPARTNVNNASKGKERFAKALESIDRRRTASPTVAAASESPAEENVISEEEVPRIVADFNARLASQRARRSTTDATSTDSPGPVEAEQDAPSEEEEEIMSTQPGSQDRRKGPLPNAFDRMRPKRSLEQTATVTIGDTTTQVTLGGSSSKRRRVHTPKFGMDGQRLSQASPLMGRSLRQFAAPGTQFKDEEASESEDVSLDASPEPIRASHDEELDGSITEDSGGDDTATFATGTESVEELEQQADADSPLFVEDDSPSDAEYLDEEGKKQREEERVAKIVAMAEEEAARPTEENLERAAVALQPRSEKDSTLQLVQHLEVSASRIENSLQALEAALRQSSRGQEEAEEADFEPTVKTAEEQLSLTVSKSDFGAMRIVGQFNLGFIVALRLANGPEGQGHANDDLFIIDQHAADEKYNFERLSSNTILQNQRMVRPLTLDLTAVEEEIVMNHPNTLTQNGFQIETDTSGKEAVGRRCKLYGLPMSKEVVFNVSDLEELIALLGEGHTGDAYSNSVGTASTASDSSFAPTRSSNLTSSTVIRPSKIRRLLAMRACRSSIMVGRTLTTKQMTKVVRNMGEMDKPWNCPHGRPTMRHLRGFGTDQLGETMGWAEGMGLAGLGEDEEVFKWPKREA